MWIVLINFALFIFLIGVLFHGLHKWTRILTEEAQKPEKVTDYSYHRFVVWLLIAGYGLYSLINDLIGTG